MTRDELFTHLEHVITGRHVAHNNLLSITEMLGYISELASQCPCCENDPDVVEERRESGILLDARLSEDTSEGPIRYFTIPQVLEDSIAIIGNNLISKGMALDEYFSRLEEERVRQTTLWSPENDAKLNIEDWFFILEHQLSKAVNIRLREATGHHQLDTFKYRQICLAATFLAALENLYPS